MDQGLQSVQASSRNIHSPPERSGPPPFPRWVQSPPHSSGEMGMRRLLDHLPGDLLAINRFRPGAQSA